MVDSATIIENCFNCLNVLNCLAILIPTLEEGQAGEHDIPWDRTLKVVWAEFSTLSWAILLHSRVKSQPVLKLQTQPRFYPSFRSLPMRGYLYSLFSILSRNSLHKRLLFEVSLLKCISYSIYCH